MKQTLHFSFAGLSSNKVRAAAPGGHGTAALSGSPEHAGLQHHNTQVLRSSIAAPIIDQNSA